MPSAAKQAFDSNSNDVQELWSIRQGLSGKGKNANGINVMNRSAVIFITAAWESYVEDFAMEAFDHLLANATTASQIPAKVRTLATKSIWEQKDPSRIWDIADAGWRTYLVQHRETVRTQWLGSFNTPKTEQVNGLYRELLGIRKLSDAWSWKAMSASAAGSKLDGYVTIRGDIAHRLKHAKPVHQHVSKKYQDHVERIVDCCEAHVGQYLVDTVGSKPW